jgi:hypothetical protein
MEANRASARRRVGTNASTPSFAFNLSGLEASMAPRSKPRTDVDNDDTQADGPIIQQQDWDAIKGGKILPDSDNGNVRYDTEKDGDLPEEDDDNAYQESDDALPDDQEEAAISRHPTREGRFDET